ncbi:uncharacterized protein L3040_006782 [Drepanopeziza brunnea f. sp. 'multigermtubi']|uniref:uncharacterized protein n=1 Tax=Drepanopeziza brunnea f. sp. 'multigermtubi' TaxID=698441 RepID=UPI00238A98B0|nr:hypothetical protein L3040_006782 [Drepanopeziza brunnea f. sp. 'multigermtubi']
MQSIDPRGSENIQGASGTSARAQTTGIQAPRISTKFTDPFSRPAEPPSMLPNDPSTRNTFEAPNEDTSDLGFNLDSLPYSKPESHTKARLIIEDFLDIKSKGLKDHELWSLFRHAFARWTADEFSLAAKQAHGRGNKFTLLIKLREYLLSKGVWCLPRQKGYANGLASIIQMEKEHQWTWEEQRAQQAAIEGFDSRWNDITIARLNRQTEEVARIQGKQVERFPDQSGLIRLTKIIDEPSLANSLRQSLREEYEELRRQKDAIARDLDDLRNLTITRDAQQRKERIEEATRHKEELEAAKATRQSSRRSSRSSRDSLPSPVPLLLQPAILSPKEYAREYNEYNDEPLNVEAQGRDQTYRGYNLKEESRREEDQGNGYRQGRAQGYEQKREQASASNPNDPDDSDGDPKGGNKKGNEWNGHGRRGGGHGGPTRGQGNKPPRDPGQDPGRGYEPPGGPGPNRPLTSTPFSTRVLARHTYGTPSDPDDDDFPELGTADPHPRAKELALFARSFPKELKYSGPEDDFKTQLSIFADQANRYGLTLNDYLAAFLIMLTGEAISFYYNHVIKAKLPTFKANAIAIRDHFETDQRRQANYDRWEEISLELIRKENPANSLVECFEKLEKELRAVQRALRPGLKDDRSLADKLYSACKNVPETTIARMNPAITFTAAIADIRRAIAFATEIIQPLKSESSRPSKASRAYASSSEPFDHSQHSSQHSSQTSPQRTSSKADSDDLEDEYECFIQGCQYGGEHCEHFAK